jgi:hypothetical protein
MFGQYERAQVGNPMVPDRLQGIAVNPSMLPPACPEPLTKILGQTWERLLSVEQMLDSLGQRVQSQPMNQGLKTDLPPCPSGVIEIGNELRNAAHRIVDKLAGLDQLL